MENQIEKKTESGMDTGVTLGLYGNSCSHVMLRCCDHVAGLQQQPPE